MLSSPLVAPEYLRMLAATLLLTQNPGGGAPKVLRAPGCNLNTTGFSAP